MHTEQQIKAALDGTFTRIVIDERGTKIVKTDVPLDFIPDHHKPAPPENHGQRGPGKGQRHTWTPEEEVELVELRRRGWSKMRCALHFGASEDSVRNRLKMIRTRGEGVEA